MNRVYVIYLATPPMLYSPSPCVALAFVEDDTTPDGFAVVASHLSSSWGWAWKDIRNQSHKQEYRDFFKNGEDVEILDVVGAPIKDDHDLVIEALKRAKEGGAK